MSIEFDQAFERILRNRKPAPLQPPSRRERIVAYCASWRTMREIGKTIGTTRNTAYHAAMKLVRSGHLESRRVGGGPERVRWEVRAVLRRVNGE